MADTFTPNFNFVLPEIGGSPDTWGNKLNENFSELDGILQGAMPPGGVILWSGSVGDIPAGWALCNGSNGTPDLRGRFVVGAGGNYGVGDTGGAESVTLTTAQMPSHNHGGSTGNHTHSHSASTGNAGSHSHSGSTNTTGSHSHTYQYRPNLTRAGTGAGNVWQNNEQGLTSSAGSHSHSLNINSSGSHSHSVNVNNNTHSHGIPGQGGGESHENRPPYYALCYIMKL